ncbi:MAG: bacteriohemerythrin [Magnetococcales bacterium]|nr:bacteriohemerythrin [Magnetococcales bacterium]NGZ04769.1 bacteriohemerythrin [Magnetococcales bacterium]
MNITQKIYLGFLSPLLMLLILGIWGIVVTNQVTHETQRAYEHGFKLAIRAKQMELHVIQVQQWLTDISATRAASGLDDGFRKADEHAKQFLEGVDSFIQLGRSQQDPALLKEMETLTERFQSYYAIGQKMAKAYIEGGPVQGNALMNAFDTQAESFTAILNPFLERYLQLAENRFGLIERRLSILQGGTIFILLAALGVVVFLGWRLGRSLTQPIHAMVGMMEQVGNGDLTMPPRNDQRQDELGLMQHHVDRVIRIFGENIRQINLQAANITAFVSEILTLRQSIGTSSRDLSHTAHDVAQHNHALIHEIQQIKDHVDQSVHNLEGVHGAARQVADGISTIANTTEQANDSLYSMSNAAQRMLGNIERVHSQVTEVHDAISSVADSAEEMKRSLENVRQRCHAAVFESDTARDQAREAEAVMEKLSFSAHEIGAVIEIINGITEQTFMLALNAAIEAAGAGEAGKGFAVVATEVKELARQTANATLLIQSQIEAIREQTREAKEKTDTIHDAVERISAANAAINQSVSEQSQATDQIVQATGKVEQATAEVNHGAEELQQAASEVAFAAERAAQSSQEIANSSEQIAILAQEMEDRTYATVEAAQAIQQAAGRTDQLAADVRAKTDHSLQVVAITHGIVNHFQSMGDVVGGISEALYAAQARMDIGPEPFNIRRIKEAVLRLMYRLHMAITTHDPSLADQIADPRSCLVTRWLDDEVRSRFGALPLFDKMEATHDQLHKTAMEILELVRNEKPDEVQDAFMFFHELRKVLFEQLNQLYLGEVDDHFSHAPLIRWRDSLSVGIQAFDIDHRNLIERINQLHTAIQQQHTKEEMQRILEELINYATTHFTREERLLADHGYSHLEGQQQQHNKFLNYIKEQTHLLHREDSFALASELLKYLKDWLLQHILKHDMRYKEFLVSKGVK